MIYFVSGNYLFRDVESTRVRVRPYGEDFKIYKYRGKFFEKYFPFINKFSQFSRRILFSIYASIRSCTVLVPFIFVKLRKRPSFFLSYCQHHSFLFMLITHITNLLSLFLYLDDYGTKRTTCFLLFSFFFHNALSLVGFLFLLPYLIGTTSAYTYMTIRMTNVYSR